MDDLDALVKHANNPKIACNLTDAFPHPYTVEAGKRFIAMQSDQHPTRVFAIEIAGEAAGGIGIHPKHDIHRLNAELGYWLSEDHWGKGIITEAVKQIVPYAFDHFAIHRLYAIPFGSNAASRRVLEKAGFVLEGHFKETIVKGETLEDEWVFAVRRPDVT